MASTTPTDVTRTGNKGTRQRLIEASAELFGRDGFAATGVKAILAASGAPYGSMYHFFPGGKEELGAAGVRASGEGFCELVELYFPPGVDVVAATTAFFDGAAALLEATEFADACPIATIALETASRSELMRIAAAEAFASWLAVLELRFAEAGIAPPRAKSLAIESFCAIEGAFLLCRVTRSVEALRVTGAASAAKVRDALREVDRE